MKIALNTRWKLFEELFELELGLTLAKINSYSQGIKENLIPKEIKKNHIPKAIKIVIP